MARGWKSSSPRTDQGPQPAPAHLGLVHADEALVHFGPGGDRTDVPQLVGVLRKGARLHLEERVHGWKGRPLGACALPPVARSSAHTCTLAHNDACTLAPPPPPPNTGDRVPLGLQDPLGALHNPQSPSFFHRQKKGGVTPPPPNLALSGILFAQTLVQPPPTRQSHGHPDSTGAARAQIHRSGSPDPGSPGPAHAQGGLCHSACTCHWKSWGAGGGGGLEEGPTADDCRRAGGSCSTLRRKVYSASP